MHPFKKLWLLFLVPGAVLTSAAQDPITPAEKKCSLRTLNYEAGLLNNSTTFVLTDVQGFTWISTRTGLQRFNGNKLETIVPVIDNDTLNINHPVYLFNLHNGFMWICYNNQVIEYNPFRNSFRKMITLEPGGNNWFDIVPLKETPEGVWCMQKAKGICIYSTGGKIKQTFSFYKKETIDSILSSDDMLYKDIVAVNSACIFIASFRNEVLKINTATGKMAFLNAESSYRPGLACFRNTLFTVADGRLLLINVDSNSITKRVLIKDLNSRTLDNYALCVDAKGHVFLSASNHLYEFDSAGNYQTEITDLNRNPVVTAGFINKIYRDKFRRIWLLTNDNVVRIQDQQTPFTHFTYPGTKNNFIRSLYYIEDKSLLLAGCLNAGLELYDTTGNPLWKEPLATKDVRDVLSIERLTNDDFLIVTFGNGWYTLKLSAKQIRPFDFPPALKAILEPQMTGFTDNTQRVNDSTIFIATGRNIFECIFNKTRLRSVKRLLPAAVDFQNKVDCFLYTKNKTLWVGTSGGILYRISGDHAAVSLRVPGNYIVRTITEDAVHNIWVGTEKGLCVYSPQGRFLKELTVETGLLNDCMYSLLPVADGSAVFAGSNFGISYISLQGVVKNYSKELSLQDLEFNTASCVKTRAGKLYFGGVDGITSFYPRSLSVTNDTPGIFITRLVINDISYNFSAALRHGDSIVSDYSKNHLLLDITALGLLNPDEYVYKYRLKGFQDQWEVTHQPNNINYILPPGKYVLEIICSPNLLTNIYFKKNIIILISGPWWSSWWFILIAILLSVILIVLMVHVYNRNLYNQKLKLLQAKSEMQLERERISRDLHDNLGAHANVLIHGTEQLQYGDSPDKDLINNLNTTARDMMHSLRDTIWVMKSNDIRASEIWFRIISFSKQLNIIYKEIKIAASGELPEQFSFSSEKSLHIVLVVQEALNNAVKHSQAKNINVVSVIENNTWIIKIKDNGRGITGNPEAKSAKAYGLNNMRERCLLAGIELTIDTGTAKGTSIVLQIPPVKNHPN